MKQLLIRKLSPLKPYKSVLLTAVFFLAIGDTVIIESKSDLVIFGVLGLYTFSLLFYKISSKASLFFCFAFVIILFFEFIFTGDSVHAEKAAVWLFLFMVIGVLHEFLSVKNET